MNDRGKLPWETSRFLGPDYEDEFSQFRFRGHFQYSPTPRDSEEKEEEAEESGDDPKPTDDS